MAAKSSRHERISLKASSRKQPGSVPALKDSPATPPTVIKETGFSLPKAVYVVWEDITIVNDGGLTWLDSMASREYEPRLIHQLGFLVKEFPDGIHLAEAHADGLISQITQIPKVVIKEMVYL